MNGAQQEILEMIRSRKVVLAREIVRSIPGWDHRKAISRLRRQGYPIQNIASPGAEAMYAWVKKEENG